MLYFSLGWGCQAFCSDWVGFVFHRRHKHTLHIRWPCRHCVSVVILWQLSYIYSLNIVVLVLLNEVEFCFLFGVLVQGNYACNVEASKVQVHISSGYSLCIYTDSPLRRRRLLGFWRPTSQPFQRLLPPPPLPVARRRRHSHAHSPSTYNFLS